MKKQRERKDRHLVEDLNRAGNLVNTSEKAEYLPAGPLGVIVPLAVLVLPELSHGICSIGLFTERPF